MRLLFQEVFVLKIHKLIAGALSLCIMGTNFTGLNVSAAGIAASGKCGENAVWTLDSEGTLTVSGTGAMTDYNISSSSTDLEGTLVSIDWSGEAPPWFELGDRIKKINIGEGITSIGCGSFVDCDNLTEVNLPDSLTYLGGQTFMLCDSLEEITIPDNVEKLQGSDFQNCISLKKVVLPESLKYIGYCEFEYCKALESIVIPESTEEIYNLAFSCCYSLNKMVILSKDCLIADSESTINRSCKLYGYTGSTAQTYAEKYGRYFLSVLDAFDLGDVNFDGKINAVDASFVLSQYAIIATTGKSTFNSLEKTVADADGNTAINSIDASIILSYYAYTATGGFSSLEEFLSR